MSDGEPEEPPCGPEVLHPAMLAHELRSPLGAIQGFAALIADQAYGPLGDPRYVEAAIQVVRACTHMEGLVSGILDDARMHLGEDRLDEAPVDLSDLVATAVSWLRKDIVDAGVVVRARVALRPIRVLGDQRRLRQAVLNVIENAIRYTPRGGHIDVVIGLATAGGVEITIRNDGGADRGAGEGARRGGCGLGLYITRCQMRAHGGEVTMRRSVEGATVVLSLPAERRLPEK